MSESTCNIFSESEARALIDKFISQRFAKCGDNYRYVQLTFAYIVKAQLAEFKGKIQGIVQSDRLSQADRLNGIEYRAVVSVRVESPFPARTAELEMAREEKANRLK